MKKALTESQLGESVTGGGLSDELQQCTFSVGLKGKVGVRGSEVRGSSRMWCTIGVKPEDAPKVEELVLSLMNKLAVEGFEQDAIQAAMNTMEFRLSEALSMLL